MKSHSFSVLPAMILCGLTLSVSPGFAAYNIAMNFLVNDPVMFPVGNIVTGDLSSADEIAFEDIEPFFRLNISGSGSDSLYLLIRLETGDQPIFTVTSTLFPVNVLFGRSYTNYELARVEELHIGRGGEEVNAGRLMPYIDRGMLREGIYELSVILSRWNIWETALNNHEGIASLPIVARNANQVSLITPEDRAVRSTNPIFIWSFPRSPGVQFTFKLVTGPADADPWTAVEYANPANVYAEVPISVAQGAPGGLFTAFTYTGTGDQRALQPNQTYFWRVTAVATTMFEDDTEVISSSAYRFFYQAAGGGGGLAGGGEGGGGGGDPGGGGGGGGGGGNGGGGKGGPAGPMGGGDEEGGPPPNLPPVFNVLQNVLPADLYDAIMSQLGGDIADYSLVRIRVGDRVMSLDELAAFLLAGNRQILSVTVE